MRLIAYAENLDLLTLMDVKNYLRIDTDDDDSILENIIIPGVRAHAETITNSILRKAQLVYTIQRFPESYFGGGIIKPLELNIPNVRSIDTITYTDNSGNSQAISTARALIDNGQVKIINSATWPHLVNPALDAVQITLTAGYLQAEFFQKFPSVYQWMLLAAGWAYNQRDLFSNDAKLFAQMPETYTNGLLQPAHAIPSF